MKNKQNKESQCWNCRNAVPNPEKGYGCNWSRSRQPVPGWETIDRLRLPDDGYSTVVKWGHKVCRCPEYKRG